MSAFRSFAEKMHLSSDCLLDRRCFIQRGGSSWAMRCLPSCPVTRDSQWVQWGGESKISPVPTCNVKKDTGKWRPVAAVR